MTKSEVQLRNLMMETVRKAQAISDETGAIVRVGVTTEPGAMKPVWIKGDLEISIPAEELERTEADNA